MKKNLVIVPTRCRNANHLEFAQEFFKNSQTSDLIFGLDEDDQHNYERVPRARYHCHPRSEKRMNGQVAGYVYTLNLLARKYASQYEYIFVMGDDVRIRTPHWDTIMYEKMKNIPLCIAYGNDLLQGELLCTHAVMDTRIIRTLGYMAPPQLFHYYVDNFWLELGKELGTLTYFSDIILEHMHHSNNKSKLDTLYQETNNVHDMPAWIDYLKTQFPLDVAKLKSIQ